MARKFKWCPSFVTTVSQHNSVTTQQCHNTSVTTQQCHNTTVSQHNSVTTQQCHNTTVSQHNSVTTQIQWFFLKKLLKVLKCYNFLLVQWRHICSPAANFANCVTTPYLLKVHLQTFPSIPITQKCQTLSCDTLVANEPYVIQSCQLNALTFHMRNSLLASSSVRFTMAERVSSNSKVT